MARAEFSASTLSELAAVLNVSCSRRWSSGTASGSLPSNWTAIRGRAADGEADGAGLRVERGLRVGFEAGVDAGLGVAGLLEHADDVLDVLEVLGAGELRGPEAEEAAVVA